MKKVLLSLVRDEEGASMVEYGLLIALIAVACIGALVALGGGIETLFDNAKGGLEGTEPAGG